MQTLPVPMNYQERSSEEIHRYMHSEDKAVLVLMEPKPQQSLGLFNHRPQVSQFTPKFRQHFEEYMYNVQTKGTTPTECKQLGLVAAQENVLGLSDQVDTRLDLRPLDESWRFLLVLKDQTVRNGGVDSSTSLNKYDVILEGYCIGEPVSPIGNHMNPECQLRITHKRVVRNIFKHGLYGQELMHSKIHHDNYVLDPFNSGRGYDPTYRVDFDSCKKDLTISDGSVVHATPMMLNGKSSPAKFSPNIYHTSSVFRDFAQQIKTTQDTLNGDYDVTPVQDYKSLAYYTQKDDFFSTLKSIASSEPLYYHRIGPDEGDYLTLKHVGDKFHLQPKIVRYAKLHVDTQTDTGTPRDIFNPLIAETLMGLMAHNHISYMSFSFISAYTVDREFGHQIYVGDRINSPTIKNAAEAKQMVEGIINALKIGLFQSIFNQYGEFDVAITADLTSMIYVMLNFADNVVRFNQPYQYPACYAGMVSSSMGNQQTCHQNHGSYLSLLNSGINAFETAQSSGDGWENNDDDIVMGHNLVTRPSEAVIHHPQNVLSTTTYGGRNHGGHYSRDW